MSSSKKISGIVLKSTGSWYTVMNDEGEIVQCKIKGKFKISGIKSTNPIAVGDKVKYIKQENEEIAVIDTIIPRENYIIRKSTNLSKQTHIIAANIDHAFVVVTITQPRTSSGFIDRFLATAEAYHIPSVLVFNKSDLNTTTENNTQKNLIKTYEEIGYTCIETSAITGLGLENLKDLMRNNTSLFSGHSGVGKSALVNAIQPGLKLKTSEISDFNLKGKHTTTFAEMHPLHFGGFIIDTPGIKEFGLVDFEKQQLSDYFPEIRDRKHLCKFNNCLHYKEPQCAVKKALENGEIAQSRFNNYLAILHDEELDKKPY
mgnify:CR=1 FL=1|jgi:ribosome biogenesis GTPase